jgi:hypothetical protein
VTAPGESAVKAGAFRDYVSKPDEGHLLAEDRRWTTGTFALTVNDKNGKPLQVRGHWIDMLQREGNVWMVVCLENLDSDVMVMKSAENGARVHSTKMLDRAS